MVRAAENTKNHQNFSSVASISPVKRLLVFCGILLFATSLTVVLPGTKEKRYSMVEIEEASMSSGISARKSVLFGDIVYAQNTFLSFENDDLGRIEVEAERSVYNMKKGVIELSGNVRLRAKDIYAETTKAKLYIQNNVVVKIEGHENIRVETGGRTISSRSAEIYPKDKLIVFSGDPKISQKGLEIRGRVIKVFLDSDMVEIEDTKAVTEK